MKLLTAALAMAIAIVPPGPTAVAETSTTNDVVVATFEGMQIDLTKGWGTPEARPEIAACHVTSDAVTCFRSERAMNASVPLEVAAQANCSSSLRLYDGTGFGGAVLSLSERGAVLALANFGFDNRTSSYQVGACSARFYSGFGSGTYPGTTTAGATASSMLSGWSNVMSSVAIL